MDIDQVSVPRKRRGSTNESAGHHGHGTASTKRRRGPSSSIQHDAPGSFSASVAGVGSGSGSRKRVETMNVNVLEHSDLQSHDYVNELVMLLANRHGVHDFLLSQHCKAIWDIGNDERFQKVTLSVKLNHHAAIEKILKQSPFNGHRAVFTYPYFHVVFSNQTRTGNPSQAFLAMDCCKRYVAKCMVKLIEQLAGVLQRASRNQLRRDVEAKAAQWRRELFTGSSRLGRFEKAIEHVRALVRAADGGMLYGATIRTYGSYTTGLVVSDSDLDVGLSIPGLFDGAIDNSGSGNGGQGEGSSEWLASGESDIAHGKQVSILRAIEQQTYVEVNETKRMHLEGIVVVKSARVPVLKFFDRQCGLHVDISIASDKAALLSRLLRKYVQQDERVFHLGLLVKQWARNRSICGAHQGHINSMGWICMLIYYLQHIVKPPLLNRFHFERTVRQSSDITPENNHHNADNIDDNNNDAASLNIIETMNYKTYGGRRMSEGKEESVFELLSGFFKFYNAFDFERQVISVNLQAPRKIFDMFGKHFNWALFIEQPLQRKQNIVSYVDQGNLAQVKDEIHRAASLCECDGRLDQLWKHRDDHQAQHFHQHHHNVQAPPPRQHRHERQRHRIM